MAASPSPPAPSDYSGAEQQWWEPERLPGPECDPQSLLSPSQVRAFESQGWIVVDDLWPAETIASATEEAAAYFSKEETGRQHGQPHDAEGRPWGTRFNISNYSWVAMPFAHPEHGWAGASEMALNQIALHPRAMGAAAQLMGTGVDDVRISQDVVRPRYGDAHGTGNQPMHADYSNNSLVVPPRVSNSPDAVACLLYYSKLEESGAPTHLAKAQPGELTSYTGKNALPFYPIPLVFGDDAANSARLLQRLYDDERPVKYRPGTAILYRLDAFHRGTAVAEGSCGSTTI